HSLSLVVRSFYIMTPPPPRPSLFPYTTLFRSSPGRTMTDPPGFARLAATQETNFPRPHPMRNAECGVRNFREGSFASRRLPLHRSEEHTSELQSRVDLVCRLLLEKKKNKNYKM